MLKASALALRLARFSPWIALAAAAPALLAQQYAISTVAGGAPPTTPAPSTSSAIGQPRRVTVDSKNNVYFSSGNSVFKMSGSTLSLVAGNSRPGFAGDAGPAVNAQLNSPQGLAVDSNGNLYIADTVNNRVRIVTTNGIINTFAGNGQVGSPLAFGDGGPANQGNLQLPGGVAVDSSGNLYIADTGNNLIRKVTTDGIINTIAGDSLPAYSGDGGAAVNAELHSPEDVAVDSSGNVYIADTANAFIRKIGTNGVINSIAGNGTVGYSGDGGLATSAGLIQPFAVCVDSKGNVYITEPPDGRIREITASNGIINTIVGNGVLGFSGDGGSATKAMINQASGIALDASANLYIADTGNNRIRTVVNGTINTIGGNGVFAYSGDGGPAIMAQLFAPQAVAVDASGNFFIADTGNNVVREVTAKGVISTIAGNGTAGFGGDNGPATAAQLNTPQGIAVDNSGNVYVSDTANARVRKISNGTITTVAGNGTVGYSGNGGAATSAMLNTPVGLAVDKSGNLFITDHGNSVVREVSASGTINTIAGNGTQGFSGNGGPATAAQLNGPQAVAVDASGNIYIADTLNNVVREVTPGGIINAFAGNGIPGFAGDGGFATLAELASPSGVAVDAASNVYISDSGTRIRKVFATDVITTIAGTGVHGYSGDGGPATSAMMSSPNGLSTDAKGDVYISDTANNAIRQLVVTGFNLSISAVTNGASNQIGAIAPGEVLVLYGSNIGASRLTTYQLTSGGLVSTTLAGTTVYINGAPSPILYTSPNQVSAIVPFGITSTSAQIFILNQGQSTEPVTVNLAPTAPAVFTLNASGVGQAAAYNQDKSVNGSSNPAKAGSVVTFFITGAGVTNPPSQDGMLAAVPLPQPVANVLVSIGGQNATVQYAGGSQGTVNGIIQVNAVVPTGLTAGNVPVVVRMGASASQSNVTIVVSGN